MRVLHVVPSYFPATRWGGPIFSTKAICDGIAADPDIDLRVLTTNAAGPDRADRVFDPPDLGYPVHYAHRIAGHSVAPGLLARLPSAIAWADVVHLTATYSFPTLPTLALARAMGKALIWSPRGALLATADWSDTPNRQIKQWFEKLAGALRPRDAVLHVTSAAEGERGLRHLQGITTVNIPNAVALPKLASRRQRIDQGLRLMFLSRVHPKKGLEALLAAMKRLPDWVSLDIYGTGDATYLARIAQHAQALGDRVRLHGHVIGTAKAQAFAQADLFVLPTHSENFGIAIAEALSHGVPAITTTAAPWWGLDVEGCGRCLDMDQTDLAEEILSLSLCDLHAMGEKGRAWMCRDFSQDAMVAAFRGLYSDLMPLEGRISPA